MIELYHCAGTRSFRALWALEEMGLAYRLHLLPFPPRLLRPDFLALNPLGTVPLLIDGACG
jgi:glutathione S-transferase